MPTGPTTNSMIPALPYATQAAHEFEAAMTAAKLGDLATADTILIGIDDTALRAHWHAAIAAWKQRSDVAAWTFIDGLPKAERHAERMPVDRRTIYERDGWRCRWCETPVVFPDALKRAARNFPHIWQYGSRDVDRPGLLLSSGASLDHVVPHSHGGDNDPSNLVTACWACQFSRGNDTIERLGLNDPRLRAPLSADGWDGCWPHR